MTVVLSAAAPNQVLLDWLPPLLMLTGVVLLGVLVGLALRSHNRRTREAQESLSRGIEQATRILQQVEDVRTRVGELIGTAQRLSIKLEDRSDEIRELLAALDARALSIGDRASENSTPANTGASIESFASTAPAIEVAAAIESKPPHRSVEPLDPLTKAVYEMADAGHAPLTIAQELQEQIGKVQLILALRGR